MGCMCDARWLPGIYLGRALNADEYYLGTGSGGVVRSRSVNRVAEEVRWDADLVFGISGTPGKPRESKGDRHNRRDIEKSASPHRREDMDLGSEDTGGHEPREPEAKEEARKEEDQENEEPGTRGLKLCKPDFVMYGFTPKCPKCEAYQGKGQVTKANHTRQCRYNMYEAMWNSKEPKSTDNMLEQWDNDTQHA